MLISHLRQRVMFWSGVTLVPMAAFLIYYIYESMTRFISRSFTNPEFWENHWMIDKDVTLDLTTRTLYFIGWMPVIFLSCLSILVGMYLLNRLRQGLFFNTTNARLIQLLGGVSVVTVILDTLMESVSVVLITAQNADGGHVFAYQYDPTDIKALILYSVVFTFGWMMRAAMEIDQEHKGFV